MNWRLKLHQHKRDLLIGLLIFVVGCAVFLCSPVRQFSDSKYAFVVSESLLTFARQCPIRSYARKNIGYLLAMRAGASVLIETDDDNFPRADFWASRQRKQLARLMSDTGWVNIYRYFTEAKMWPRGLPLESINSPLPEYDALAEEEVGCPIQQGLTDENPDVDAIYRLALPLPQSFRTDRRVALGDNSWSPLNSQNTTWWSDAFPLPTCRRIARWA
jgi:hypothetical protein